MGVGLKLFILFFFMSPLETEACVYQLKELREQYRGEGVGDSPILEYSTLYLDREQRQKYRVQIQKGRLLIGANHFVHTLEGGLPVRAKFYMDEVGDLFILEPEIKRALQFIYPGLGIHHSTLSGGGPVAAVGDVVVQDGIVLEISDESSHYRAEKPEDYGSYSILLIQMAERLHFLGADLSLAKFHFHLSGPSHELGLRLNPIGIAEHQISAGRKSPKIHPQFSSDYYLP